MQVTQGLQMPFSDFTHGNLHRDRALKRKGKQIHPWVFAANKMCLVPTRASDLIKPSPQNNTFVFLGTAGNSRFRTHVATGGKVSETFPGPSPTAQQLPEWTALVPKTSQSCPGGAQPCGGDPPIPHHRAQERGTHWSTPTPTPASTQQGWRCRDPWGGGRVSIPGVFSSSGKSECLLSAEVIKVGGGGWRTARVCKPIRDGWGPELLVAAGEGHQRGSPCPAAPTSQVGAVWTSRKISRFGSCPGSVRSSPQPSERVSGLSQPVQRPSADMGREELTSPFPPPPSV